DADEFARERSRIASPERTLEEVAALFPSPWIVDRLMEMYLRGYESAKELRDQSFLTDPDSQHRLAFTGYLIARTLLRADRLDEAATALDNYASDPASKELRDVIDRASNGPRTTAALEELARYFRPGEDDGLPPHAVRQGWGIVEMLALRMLREDAKSPAGHLFMAEVLMRRGLNAAALLRYRATLESGQQIFEAWTAVAMLEQEELERVASEDPDAALLVLTRLEAFHREAMEIFKDRPVQPGLPRAYVTVGESLYDAGDIDRARTLLEDSLALEPQPRAVDLLGTIALKEARYSDAYSSYESLLVLPFEDQYARLRWSIRANSQIGEIAVWLGDEQRARESLRSALETLNLVLAQPNLDEFLRAFWLTERARVLFFAGETRLAMQDFRDAVSTAPERPLTYAEPLILAVSYGLMREASEIFAQAMRHDLPPPLKLYFALWVHDLALRQGVTPPATASDFIDGFRDDGWVGHLASHARGELSSADLFARATDRGQRAEADFYEGLKAWRTGDRTTSLAKMVKVIESGMMSFFEYEMAQNYLRWSELPTERRTPRAQAPGRPPS
ncbi:MAG: tetratricopeptide repeat protein, partial [Nannocystaceae bacterium]